MDERKALIAKEIDEALAALKAAGIAPTMSSDELMVMTRGRSDKEVYVKMVCSICGSDNVIRDGALRWSILEQKWEASAEYDCTACNDCEREVDLVEVAVTKDP